MPIIEPAGKPEAGSMSAREFSKSIVDELFSVIWDLSDRDDRKQDEDEKMLTFAYTALYHAGKVESAFHVSRARWQLSRAFTSLGRNEDAVAEARRCLEFSRKSDAGLFATAMAHEGLARALAFSGKTDEARKSALDAREAAEKLPGAEKQMVLGMLESTEGLL